jgi:hypothetical protein
MVEELWPSVVARVLEEGLAQAAMGASIVTHEDVLLAFIIQARKGR